jgi:antirestriction protein ArdC
LLSIQAIDLRTGRLPWQRPIGESGSVRMESLPVQREDSTAADLASLVELPPQVRDLGRREGWRLARQVGARAYGQARKSERGGRVVHVLQAVDLAMAKIVWQRPVGEVRLHALPP